VQEAEPAQDIHKVQRTTFPGSSQKLRAARYSAQVLGRRILSP